MAIVSRGGRAALGVAFVAFSGAAFGGSFDLFGVDADWKLTMTYATAARTKKPSEALINGPIDVMHVALCAPAANPICGLTNTGLHTTTNFDDGNRDFNQYNQLNDRLSSYGELQLKFDSLGLGSIGFVGSGSAFYDLVYFNDNKFAFRTGIDDQDSVNREHVTYDAAAHNYGTRIGPINHWQDGAVEYDGRRWRLLEA